MSGMHYEDQLDAIIMAELSSVLDRDILDLKLEASFIQNGGNSLRAAALVSACKARGRQVSIKAVLTSKSLRDIISSACILEDHKYDSETLIRKAILQLPSEVRKPSSIQNSLRGEGLLSKRSSASSLFDYTPRIVASNGLSTPLMSPSPGFRSGRTSISSVSSIEEKDDQEVLTEIQLSLIHGTLKTPGMNIISYSETYCTRDIERIKSAWNAIIDMEPIFKSPAFDPFRPAHYEHFYWHEECSAKTEEDTYKAIDALRSTDRVASEFFVFPRRSKYGQEPSATVAWIACLH